MRAPRTAGPGRSRHRQREPFPPLGPPRDDGQAGLTLEVYLVRHGETEWSRSGKHTGSTDLPLTTRGEEEARALSPHLEGIHFDAVYSSPMQRALRTAHLAGFPTPRITSLLEEANYGQYEGLTSSQIHEVNPRWEIYHDGSPGGESPAQLYARAQRFIGLVDTGQNARLLAFSHGHILRAIAVAWIKADITVAGGLQLDVATVSIMRDGDHGRVITLWNAP